MSKFFFRVGAELVKYFLNIVFHKTTNIRHFMIFQVNKENGNRIIKKEIKLGKTRLERCAMDCFTQKSMQNNFYSEKAGCWELGTSPSSLNVKIISIVN